jgi:hypothetical protein
LTIEVWCSMLAVSVVLMMLALGLAAWGVWLLVRRPR